MYLSTLHTLPYPTAYPTVPYLSSEIESSYRKAYYIHPPN